MVSHSDLDTFNRATLKLYGPELDAVSYATNVVAFLRELVPADMYCVGDLNKQDCTLGVGFSNLDAALPKVLDGFARTMARYPLFNWDPAVNGGRPFFRSDFYSRRQFRDLDVWRESFSLMSWHSHAAVHVPTDDAHVVFIGLERSGPVEYTERDRALLTLAQPHLANARRLARARTRTRQHKPLDPEEFTRAGFSPREAEVLTWLIEGKSNTEMARLLGVHLQTVKFHLTSIFNKAGVGNRLAATLYAIDLGERLRRAGDRKVMTVCVQSPVSASFSPATRRSRGR
jgi:DNA-binding CsgD family transcriptional regulator